MSDQPYSQVLKAEIQQMADRVMQAIGETLSEPDRKAFAEYIQLHRKPDNYRVEIDPLSNISPAVVTSIQKFNRAMSAGIINTTYQKFGMTFSPPSAGRAADPKLTAIGLGEPNLYQAI